MRTTFCERHLFNDTSQKHDTSFILSGEEWGGGKLDGERERERTERVWEVECDRERVGAWDINLTVGHVFMRVKTKDNSRVYQDEN